VGVEFADVRPQFPAVGAVRGDIGRRPLQPRMLGAQCRLFLAKRVMFPAQLVVDHRPIGQRSYSSSERRGNVSRSRAVESASITPLPRYNIKMAAAVAHATVAITCPHHR
jgi:hypothetical protein